MGSKLMANAAPKALCQVWRCFQRSRCDASQLKAASPLLGTWPYRCMHRHDLVEVRRSPQLGLWVFHGEQLQEQLHKQLKKNDCERLRLEQIRPPESQKIKEDLKSPESPKITVDDARRLARLGRLEAFKGRLHQIPHEIISYSELLRVCMASAEQSSEEEAVVFVKSLDESGHILVSGPTVHLRPQKVVRALEMALGLSLSPEADRCSLELANLEEQKKEIDEEAEKRAKAELWWGLGFFTIKTALLMRWTFWELSWDVMEPVCFFLTSAYFMAGYAFFLRTSIAPTFEGIFKARFQARQRQIMKERNFDHERFKQLNMLSTSKFKSTAHSNQH